MKNIIGALLMSVILTSCENVDVNAGENLLFSYKPTQCSEPWDVDKYTDTGKSREDRFKLYLKDNGIVNILDFKNTTDDNIYCSACNCLSNDNYSFKISESDLQKLKKLEPFKD